MFLLCYLSHIQLVLYGQFEPLLDRDVRTTSAKEVSARPFGVLGFPSGDEL